MELRILSLGEILVEIMRNKKDIPHTVPGEYLGPYPSGAPAIFIDTAARLGAHAGFIGCVGDDDFGTMLLKRLKNDGVDVSHIKVLKGYTTGIAFVMYYSTGERRFVFHLRYSAAGQLSPAHVDEDYVSRFNVLHIMGSSLSITEDSRNACYKALEIIYKKGGIVTFDPNLRPELIGIERIREISYPVIEKSKVIMPSKTELEALTGNKDIVKGAKKLLSMGPDIVVVKLGSEGSIAVTDEKVVKMSTFNVKEIDPTGAGDVHDAAFIVGYFGFEKGLEESLKFANAAGAIKVTRFGPMEGPKNINEILEFLSLRS